MKWDKLRKAQSMVTLKKPASLMPFAFKMLCMEVRELKSKVRKLENK